MSISVNLAAAQMSDPALVTDIEALLLRTGMPAHRLELEITESQLMDNAHAAEQQLAALKALGVQLSIDDFGTGYSSFAHIQRLPISVLKIDRSFVGSVTSNEDDATIVKAIINLAHSLNMQVIAEGAETAEQVDFLGKNHCDQVQGFFFSKAVTFDDLKELLTQDDFVDRRIQSVLALGGALR